MSTDRRFALLLLCFFLSGLAALVYETAWTQQFAFVFGTSDLAVATVLAAYMAGLAAGAALAARWAPRIRRPILAYALLELGIGGAALAVPAALAVSRSLYVAVFGGAGELADQGGLLRVIFYLACSFVILMVPTGLMGATLPVLARYAVRSNEQVGPRVGFLYTANTVGAVCGTLLTAFALLPNLGIRGSIRVAIGANLLVFAAGILLARRAPPVTDAAVAGPILPAPRRWGRSELILPVMLLSGAASFIYEVLWTRLLGFLLGGSVYAFATMLGAFLTGIALGAWFASRIATDRTRATLAFVSAQIGTAALSVLAFFAINWMPTMAQSVRGISHNALFADSAVAMATLLPGTLCIGATFPLAVRLLTPDETAVTAASARIFAWNTTGAMVGAIGTAFLLLPWLGFAGTLSLAVAINLGLAVAVGGLLSKPRPRAVWVAAAGLAVLAVVRPPAPWNLLRSSPLGGGTVQGPIIFQAVGRGATVDVIRERGTFVVRVNGLPEAAVQPPGARQGRMALNNWLGALPSLARPKTKRMMIVGLGGGTIHEAIPSSVEHIDTVEIEVEVIEANRAIADKRRLDPLADPRVHLIVNDARDALTLTGKRYDAIVSQPSHPWTAGASHLYTREFFALAREHLNPDGVLAQWMNPRFMDEALLQTLVATLVEAFGHVEVFQPDRGGMIFLASARSLDIEQNAPRALAAHPQEYARLGIFCLEDLAAALILDEAGARAFSAGASINTDNRNLLAMRSPGISRGGGREAGRAVDEFLRAHDPLRGPTPGLDRDYLVRRLAAFGARERALRVAKSSRDPQLEDLTRARLEMASGKFIEAAYHVDRVLAMNPDRRARILRLKLDRRRGQITAAPEVGSLGGLLDTDRAVIEGWWHESSGDWEALRRLESRLASLSPRDPLFADALCLRAAWRLAEGDPSLAAEALRLVDMSLPAFAPPAPLLLRARAVFASGQLPGLVTTLYEILAWPQIEEHRAIVEKALAIIDEATKGEDVDDTQLADVRRRLQAILERQ